MVGTGLGSLEEYLINLGFEEERKFHSSELVNVSKELVERMKAGFIEDVAIFPYFDDSSSSNYILYIRK
ncbi:MAG: hypothetical protein WC584_03955 [Candidatus Pacearchaeota archaeon]